MTLEAREAVLRADQTGVDEIDGPILSSTMIDKVRIVLIGCQEYIHCTWF